jgi:hypothetical protein
MTDGCDRQAAAGYRSTAVGGINDSWLRRYSCAVARLTWKHRLAAVEHGIGRSKLPLCEIESVLNGLHRAQGYNSNDNIYVNECVQHRRQQ